MPDYSLLTVEDIYDFATTCELDDVRELLDREIKLNTAIAEEPAELPPEPAAPAEEPVDAVEETAKSIEDSLARILSEPAEDLSDTKPVTIDSEGGRFKNLQFGDNYGK